MRISDWSSDLCSSDLLFPVIMTVAVYLFMRGHDLPGGGFVAGLTMSVAFILQYMAGGTRWVEARLTVLPVRWIALGLLLAAFTGIAAWLYGDPFLTSYFQYSDLPLVGTVPLSSAVIFDLRSEEHTSELQSLM